MKVICRAKQCFIYCFCLNQTVNKLLYIYSVISSPFDPFKIDVVHEAIVNSFITLEKQCYINAIYS